MLTAAMKHQLDTLIKKLQKFNEVVLRLQKNSYTLQQVRAYFESALDAYPTLRAWLHSSVRIVHSARFKSGIAKTQEGREHNSNTTEKKVLCDLQIESVSEDAEDDESLSTMDRAHKRLKNSTM